VKLGIKKGLADGFEEAAKYRATFEYFRKKFVDNNNTDIESFRDVSTSTFSELCAKYSKELEEFGDIEPKAAIGIIECDCMHLKEKLLPSPQRCFDELKALIPEVARRKCGELLGELKSATEKVSKIPGEVEDFVDIMNFLQNSRRSRSHCISLHVHFRNVCLDG
jgi:dynein heavy chain